jgi:hypothetical protein
MSIFSLIFGNKKELPFNKIIRFQRVKSDYIPEIGDELNIWNKENTSQLNLYAKGSIGRQGLVGTTTNSTICHHLNETENLFVENKIVGLTNSSIDLLINMYVDKKAVEELYLSYKNQWIESLNKKYTPRSSWELRFYSTETIQKNDILLNTIDKNEIANYFQREYETIWLTNLKGEKLSAENHIRSGGIEKTLRAIFSGYELIILNFKKEVNWYYLEIGIKR